MTGFKLVGNLIPNLARFDDKAQKAIVAGANFVAPQAEAWMKDNAPWTDQTGNARQGLGASVDVGDRGAAIILYHSVYYGIFLELRWGGKYAVIEPGMAYAGPLYVKAVAALLFD